MKSTGDPILDLQMLCKLKPMTEDELRAGYGVLGWGPPFEMVLKWATGTYIVKADDGLYHPRDGNTAEIIAKVVKEES